MDILLNFISSAPLNFLVLVGGFIYLISTINSKMKDLDPIRKNATEISKTPETIKKIEDDISSLYTKVGNIEKNIKDMPDIVYDKIANKFVSQFLKTDSPISLNDRGEKLSKTINASDIASKYKEKLVSKAKNKSPYQIQQSCFDFATNEILKDLEEKDKETYERLTDAAYNEGVQVEELMQIVGLVLRDQVLRSVNQSSENIDKNIKTSERISKESNEL